MPSNRLTLAQIMGLIVVVAIAFATAPSSIAIADSLALLVTVGLAVFFRLPWSRMACWAFACYPVLPLSSWPLAYFRLITDLTGVFGWFLD